MHTMSLYEFAQKPSPRVPFNYIGDLGLKRGLLGDFWVLRVLKNGEKGLNRFCRMEYPESPFRAFESLFESLLVAEVSVISGG